ncbi:MAG: four helix bundle protein [Deltaproteobacteria bacterium]|nr:four helix bundle protein [Deltaproteobacteria bacterium]
MARGSATECAAILDVLFRLKAVAADKHKESREFLERIAQMLTKLSKSMEDR